MELNDLITPESLAFRISNDPRNAIPSKLEAWFPTRKMLGRDLKWLKAHKGLGIALAPSNEDATPVIRARGEVSATAQEMPIFREQMKIDEHDYFNMMRVQDVNDPFADEIVGHIYDDAAVLMQSAKISAERMRAQLISSNGGAMTISIGTKDNTIYNYNYDSDGSWKSSHYLQLSGNSTWDKPTTATPLDDLQEAMQYLRSIGVVPRFLLANSNTLRYLTQSSQIKSVVITASGQSVDFMTDIAARSAIQQLLGLETFAYDDAFIDYDGTTKKYYPDDFVTIIGDGILGNTYYGTTAEERTLMSNPIAQVSVIDPGVAVALVTHPGPPVITLTTVSQVVLPSFEGMDSIYVIKVK